MRHEGSAEQICFANGTLEFWVVDADEKTVEVSHADGRVVVYKSGQQIPLFFSPGAVLAVDAIFAE